MMTMILFFPIWLAAWLLLVAAAIIGTAATLLQSGALTLANNATWVMALGDPALRGRLRRERP